MIWCGPRNVLAARLPSPYLENFGSDLLICTGGHQVTARMKVTMNETVSGQEVLSLTAQFETLHLAFPASRRPMRVFRPIVEVPALPMFGFRQDIAFRHTVAFQFVSDDHARFIL